MPSVFFKVTVVCRGCSASFDALCRLRSNRYGGIGLDRPPVPEGWTGPMTGAELETPFFCPDHKPQEMSETAKR